MELSKVVVDSEPSTITPPQIPTATSMSALQLFSEVQSVYNTLSALPSLAPGEHLDPLLAHLVSLCIKPYNAEFTSLFFSIPGIENLCSRLRPLLSEAEGELERYWAERMIECSHDSSTRPQASRDLLKIFPHHQNYSDLSRLECSTLEAFLPTPPSNVAFIGSGPLPLTPFCFLDSYPAATIHNVDRDASALRISQRLSTRLGYGLV